MLIFLFSNQVIEHYQRQKNKKTKTVAEVSESEVISVLSQAPFCL